VCVREREREIVRKEVELIKVEKNGRGERKMKYEREI
jgi:hypothetical protein